MIKLNTRGDTIVEVLIAILVVSVILSGAFLSARRSQTTIRQTQERTEALKVAEAQLERVRALANTGEGDLFGGGATSTFCIDATNTKQPVGEFTSVLADDDFESTTRHPVACGTNNLGVTYHSVIRRTDNAFVVYTRWDGVGGTGNQEVQLAVRIYP